MGKRIITVDKESRTITVELVEEKFIQNKEWGNLWSQITDLLEYVEDDWFNQLSKEEQNNRRVDHFEKDKLVIDTCLVTDSEKPYETAVSHPQFNKGKWIIVETYNTKEESQVGHLKWVEKMTQDLLPTELTDVSMAEIAKLMDVFVGNNWREFSGNRLVVSNEKGEKLNV
jgi:hypothetical protein